MFKRYSIYSTCKTYIEWQANPTITTINTTAYPIENIEFPAITICSQGAAKNVMETVLVKQFETYLEDKGINGSSGTVNNNASSIGRRKRSIGSISNALTKDEVIFNLIYEFPTDHFYNSYQNCRCVTNTIVFISVEEIFERLFGGGLSWCKEFARLLCKNDGNA